VNEDPNGKNGPGGDRQPSGDSGAEEGRGEEKGGGASPSSPEAIPAGIFLAGESEPEGPDPGSAPAAPPGPAELPPPAEPTTEAEVAADLKAAAEASGVPAPGEAAPGAETPAGEPVSEAAPEAKAPPPPPPGKAAAEALLFAAETPLSTAQIAAFLGKGVKAQDVKGWLQELQAEYEQSGRAFGMEEIGGGFRLMTRPAYFSYVRNLKAHERSSRLSEAALDTLAVIAYRQPILKADVNQIRGVESGPILKTLMEKGLVRAVGRAEALGRPILYGTAKAFLDFFGLKSLKDLPKPEK
jgi:segregation and condensation protein B